MPITFDSKNRIFKLDTLSSTYLFQISNEGYLLHLYYGAKIADSNLSHLSYIPGHASNHPEVAGTDGFFSKNLARMEYPCNGCGDHRSTALSICRSTGTNDTDIRFVSYVIHKGKPMPKDLPATYADENEASTLEVICLDSVSGAEVHLFYTVFETVGAMTRRVEVKNTSAETLYIEHIASLNLDFHQASDLDAIHLYGDWAKECTPERVSLAHGSADFSSRSGSSSHFQNPFFAVCDHDATEQFGRVWGFNFVYSGNFENRVEQNTDGFGRVLVGIHPQNFTWKLVPGDTFVAPEAISVYSEEGIGGMSRIFHRLFRKHLCRGYWKDRQRPILINNWEATFFQFNEEKLYGIAKTAAELGVEMFVLDDGWFGKRDHDRCGLGDWFVNETKLKGGLKSLVDKINALGMKFGLWFEPEMISEDSDLYRAHPDWVLQCENRERSIARTQYVLNFSREDVVECIFAQMKKVLDSANIAYVKWDFNRNLTEVGNALLEKDRQKEVSHRYVLGLYRLLTKLTEAYPQLLIEGCSSGGGRFDPAWLYYAPQFWASDNSDAIDRMSIQYGTSYAYPLSAMGAHVSACPNHQTGRITPFSTRGDVAMFGTFGYELDVSAMTNEEKEAVKQMNRDFKKINPVVRNGDFYRLISPFGLKKAAWEVVSEDKKEAYVFFAVIRKTVMEYKLIKPLGLDPDRLYREEASGRVLTGKAWMNAGICIEKDLGDFQSVILHLSAEEEGETPCLKK